MNFFQELYKIPLSGNLSDRVDKEIYMKHIPERFEGLRYRNKSQKETTTYPHKNKSYQHECILIRKESIIMKPWKGQKTKDLLDGKGYYEYNRRDIPKYLEKDWEANSYIRK